MQNIGRRALMGALAGMGLASGTGGRQSRAMPSADPQDAFLEWASSNPHAAAIELDRELVRVQGLRAFIKLAWKTVEGGKPYKSNWHIDAICEHLEAISRGEIKRLIIAVPPRHMKSVSVAVMWPAWDWIDSADRRSLFASYAESLSIRDSARCRRVIQSPWYQARWGDRFRITSDQNTKKRFENDKTGYRLATSVGGTLTGEGGSIVVVDDPLNSSDSDSALKREGCLTWWSESMSTRLNDPAEGAFVIIQQRLHTRDLIGDILEKHGVIEDGGEYVYLCLPAEYDPSHPNVWFRDPRTKPGELLWPTHVPQATVESLKRSLGPYAAAGQLQQLPAPREGGIFKRSWFKIEQVAPPDLEFARGWDLAASEAKVVKSDPDYTATAKIGFSRSKQRWYIVDIQRWRENAGEIERIILDVAETDAADGTWVRIALPQDPGQAGKGQAQALMAKLGGHDVRAEPQSGDKLTRAMPFAGQASAHNISLIAGDWNEDFLVELTSFPNSAHDDQVDAVASAFNRLRTGTSGLMEYYERQLDAHGRRQVEAMEKLAATGTLPGLVVLEDQTHDLGRAFIAGSKAPT